MNVLRWQFLVGFLGVILLLGLLGNLAFTRTTTLVPDRGGTYVEGLAGRPRLINPLFWQNEAERDLVALLFRGLTTIDEQGLVVPDLAQSWEISEDGRTYTFKLRDDVRWHDGQPFTAEDVAFTIGVMQNPAYVAHPELATLWRTVQVKVIDPYTVQFKLQEPFSPFLEQAGIGILPAHILAPVPVEELDSHPFNTKPVGTGPFRVKASEADALILEPNPYDTAPPPYLTELRFQFYRDHPSLVSALERGEVQAIGHVRPGELGRLVADPNILVYSAPQSTCALVYLNLEKPFFKDKLVRQALLMAVDRQALVDQVLGGQGIVLNSPLFTSPWAQEPVLERYGYDPEQAAKLLDQAGWRDTDGDGVRNRGLLKLAFTLLTNDDPLRVQVAQALQAAWRHIGAQVNLEVVDPVKLSNDYLRLRRFDAVLYGWDLAVADPDPYPLWHSTQIRGGQNYAGFSNPEADAILEEARHITDPATRAVMYRRFQDIFAEEVPALLLFQNVYHFAISAAVQGVQLPHLVLTPGDRYRSIRQWYMKTRRVVVPRAKPLDLWALVRAQFDKSQK